MFESLVAWFNKILEGIRGKPAVPKILFFHVKHDAPGFNTKGQLQQIYNIIQANNKTGVPIGFHPQCAGDWATQLGYFAECKNIPTMLPVLCPSTHGTGEPYKLSTDQINQALAVCKIECFNMQEAVSYHRDIYKQPFPTDYAKSIFALAKSLGKYVFWSEWDWSAFPVIAQTIRGYEDTVAVSLGTNANYIEPAQGFKMYLWQFKRRGASVQSWYWWERHGRVSGTEKEMPTELMIQHTREALAAGCEIIQYEPFWYFFENTVPRPQLTSMLSAPFAGKPK